MDITFEKIDHMDEISKDGSVDVIITKYSFKGMYYKGWIEKDDSSWRLVMNSYMTGERKVDIIVENLYTAKNLVYLIENG
jgi:hypothetical protein